MKFITTLLLIILLNNILFSQRLKKISSIYMKIDTTQAINKGVPFKYSVIAKLKNGKEKSINTHHRLSIKSDGISKKTGSFQDFIIDIDNNCDKNVYYIDYSLSNDNYKFAGRDSIKLNYRGKIVCNFSGKKGSNGSNGREGGTQKVSLAGAIKGAVNMASKSFIRDGNMGQNGMVGYSGEDAKDIKVFVRKDSISNLIKIDLVKSEDNKIYCYKTTSLKNGFNILLKGGDGGNGGNGGDGGSGSSEFKSKKGNIRASGNGGQGGSGGQGGNGGNGGSAIIYLHKDLNSEKKFITIENSGGKKGKGGKGGKGGVPGKNLDGTISKKSGTLGDKGYDGIDGKKGKATTIKIVDDYNFNIISY